MNQSQRHTVEPAADQLMRRLLNAVSRLQATCTSDADALRGMRERRQSDISGAEKSVREQVGSALSKAPHLGDTGSLGGRLRADLAALPTVTARHIDPGMPPATFNDAVAEWRQLAVATDGRVKGLVGDITAWNQKLIKRAKTMPVVPDQVWRDLDRLDLIHRSVPVLQQSVIAGAIREVTDAADVVLAAETENRLANQRQLASEVRAAIDSIEKSVGLGGASWADPRWDEPLPAERVEHLLRLGELQVGLPRALGITSIPALVAFPFGSGIAVGSDVANRDNAANLMRALILRMFASIPPGQLHVKAVDPVSLGQSVAEFRHLNEYDASLMDEKTWTAERDIERLMQDLSDHLEVVISKYLRGQFETIDDYNEHAGEVAQPYRLLVVFDYPAGFSDRASRQLLSLIENGPRCGVYTMLHYDRGAPARNAQREITAERLTHAMQKVTWSASTVQLQMEEPVGSVGLGLLADEAAPVIFDKDGHPETGFAKLLPAIGAQVRQRMARPPAVTLDTLLPVLSRSRSGILPDYLPGAAPLDTSPSTWWQASTADTAVALLGRSGAQGVTSMFFSSTDVAGGAIMVGLPRSGKTTSLHSMILTMAMLYSPEELELYLIDAKHGVEFKIYEHLPHARMVSVHSDREFSLAVLKSIEAKIRERAELMKREGSGSANITEYRRATGRTLPRIVVIIDEFHEIFEEPDRIGQEAFAAFSNIVRMGPFSGVHIVVASQTLSSMPSMDRPTLMLLPQRVVFMCNEYDAELVMGDLNKAPRLLTKTGEGLFNPSRGEESRNQPFQGLFIRSNERGRLLAQIDSLARQACWTRRPRVFDGDAAVDRPPSPRAPDAASRRFAVSLGEPFTLDSKESLVLRRTRGANVLLLGDSEESNQDLTARAALHSFLIAGQAQAASMTVIDFVGDEEIEGALSIMDLAKAVGASYHRSSGAAAALGALAERVQQRTAAGDYKAPTTLLVLFGLERALALAPYDPYASDDAAAPSLSQLLTTVLCEGPEVGVHCIVSTDRQKTFERRIGGDLLPEVALRIAGSGADHQDIASVSGHYGDVPPLRIGQLIIGDHMRGRSTRIRGYTVLTEIPLSSRQGD